MSRKTRAARPQAVVRKSPPPSPRGNRAFGYAALLVVLALLVFTNALSAPFVMDDRVTVVENPNIRSLTPIGQALGSPPQGQLGHPLAGRPVPALSFALTYAAAGLDPAGYRIVNLGIHLLAALVLFGILRRTFRGPRLPDRWRGVADGLAFSAAAIWLVHPIQTEVVDYVTQRTESIMGLCYLFTLYAAIRSMSAERHARQWTLAAVVGCCLGMASKESMVTAPLMVLLYDAVFVSGSIRRALAERRALYTGLALSWGLLVALNIGNPRSRSAGVSSGVSPWMYLLNQAEILVEYLRITIWPTHLVLDYGQPVPTTIGAVLPQAILVMTLLAATLIAWFKQPQIAFLATWVWITLAPTSSIVPIGTEVGAERRMYLPLAALATLVVAAGYAAMLRLRVDDRARRRIAIGALAAACVVLGTLTLQRNALYRDPVALWRSVLDRKPHGRAHYNLALALDEQGHQEEALLHIREAARLNQVEAYYALALQMEKAGKYDDAIAAYQTFVRLAPLREDVPGAYVRIGLDLAAQGKFSEAADAFRRTLEMRPKDPDASISLADALLHADRYDEAVAAYRRYLAIVPTNPAGHHNLGLALVGLNRDAEAVEEFGRAVTLSPRDAGYRLSHGNALAAIAKIDEAVAEYRAGLTFAPDDARLRHLLGVTLVMQGRFKDAMPELQRAAALAPDNEEIQADYQTLASRLPH